MIFWIKQGQGELGKNKGMYVHVYIFTGLTKHRVIRRSSRSMCVCVCV